MVSTLSNRLRPLEIVGCMVELSLTPFLYQLKTGWGFAMNKHEMFWLWALSRCDEATASFRGDITFICGLKRTSTSNLNFLSPNLTSPNESFIEFSAAHTKYDA